MIDFKSRKFEGHSIRDEDKKMLEEYTQTIQNDLNEHKTNFFYLGVHLIDLFTSKVYAVYGSEVDREQLRLECKLPIGAGNHCSEFFFAYCFKTFGLEKTQISRYMNIVDEFGNQFRGFKKCWDKYSYSQLSEMLPLYFL